MGSMTAIGFAGAVSNGEVSLEDALRYHLYGNHYPPLPLDLLPVALAAIEAGNDEDWDRLIDMPDGMSFRERNDGKVRAGDAIESMHLDAFLADREEDTDD